MRLPQILVLTGKELLWGPKNFVFIMAVVTPIVLSFMVTAMFGGLFADQPRLGIYDEGDSQLTLSALNSTAFKAGEYLTAEEMIQDARRGAVDMGIILPAGFDSAINAGQTVQIDAYIWGESLVKNRTILGVAMASMVRTISGHNLELEITPVVIGDEESVPWEERLLPLIVLMGIFLGGTMLPATSIINEKQKKTINALMVTPASLGDIIISKAIMGVMISFAMGVLVLVINQAFGTHPGLLVGVLLMGAVMAVEAGLLLGIYARDISTLFAAMKTVGILLYAPAFVYMFPALPEWIARIFPTYYVIQPVVDISQNGEGWSGVMLEVTILAALIVLIGFIVAGKTRSVRERLA